MRKEYHFPTAIYIEDLPNAIELNRSLEEHIIKWSTQEPGLKKTNVKGWHSPDMTQKKEYHPLMLEILKVCENIFKEEQLEKQPAMGNMWANINGEKAYNKVHTHPNCFFSGTYYIKTPTPSAPLIIYDPRPGVHILMPRRKEIPLPPQLRKDFYFEPQAGQIIIFPSWIWHEVELSQSKETRISVAFNILQQ